jgi:hypothetical protein
MRRLSLPRGRRLIITLVVTLLVLAGLFAVVGLLRQQGASSGTSSTSGSSAGSDSLQRALGSEKSYSIASAVPAPSASGQASSSSSGSATVGTTGGTSVDINAAIPPDQGRFLVRTGELELQLARGTLDRTVQQITSLTSAFGGYILSSAVGQLPSGPTPVPIYGGKATGVPQQGVSTTPSVAPSEGGTPYAWISLRVPANRFDQAVTRFEQLGKVQVLTTSAQDVTGQVVDVQARLSHYRAVLARLLTFLNKATTVGSALAVQDRIDQTQLIVEQLSAELKQLNETVSYSTLSLSLTEKPVKHVVAHHGTGFGGTISHSGWLIAQGAGAILLGLSAALPFIALVAVLAVLAFYAARVLRRRRQDRVVTSGPAGPPAPRESI